MDSTSVSFSFAIARMIASTMTRIVLFSLVVYATAVLDLLPLEKRGGVTSMKIRHSGYLLIPVIIDAWSDQVVTLHNEYRAQYGARPLEWSASLHAGAIQYAQKCRFAHRCVIYARIENDVLLNHLFNFSQVIRRVDMGKIW